MPKTPGVAGQAPLTPLQKMALQAVAKNPNKGIKGSFQPSTIESLILRDLIRVSNGGIYNKSRDQSLVLTARGQEEYEAAFPNENVVRPEPTELEKLEALVQGKMRQALIEMNGGLMLTAAGFLRSAAQALEQNWRQNNGTHRLQPQPQRRTS